MPGRLAAGAWLGALVMLIGISAQGWNPVAWIAIGLAVAAGVTLLLPVAGGGDAEMALVPLISILLLCPGLVLGSIDTAYPLLVLVPLLWLGYRHDARSLAVGTALALLIGLGGVLRSPMASLDELVVDVGAALFGGLAGAAALRLVASSRHSADAAARAETDSLTGARATHWWHAELPRRIAAAAVDGGPLTMVLLRPIGLEEVADERGRDAAERELATVVADWRAELEPGMELAMVAASEFAVLTSLAGSTEARDLVRRLRGATRAPWSLHAGVATWDGEEQADDLVARADVDLHRTRSRTDPSLPATAGGPDWSRTVRRLIGEGGIQAVYQPIRRIDDGSVLGWEALARPVDAAAELAVEGMFTAAGRLGLAAELELLCRQAAVEGAASADSGALLFVNLGISGLSDHRQTIDQLQLLLRSGRRRPADIVLEVHEGLSGMGRFAEALSAFRDEGFQIALEGVGDGVSTLEALTAVRPNFIKMGRRLTAECNSLGACGTIRGLLEFARVTGARLIAQGIETAGELAQLRELGIHLGQGFALGRPAPLDAQALSAPPITPMLVTSTQATEHLDSDPQLPGRSLPAMARRRAPVPAPVLRPAGRRVRPGQRAGGIVGALAGGTVVLLLGALAPVGTVQLPWAQPVSEAVLVAGLGLVALLGYADAVSRRDSRALPVANASLGSAVLWLFALLSEPGVLPTPIAGGQAEALTFYLAHIGMPALLLWALIQRPRPLEDARRMVAWSAAIAGACAGLCATVPFLARPLLAGFDASTLTVTRTALSLTALVPVVLAARAVLMGRDSDARTVGGIAAAIVLLAFEAATAPWTTQPYTAMWYAAALLRVLPAFALLGGQINLYRESVAAEMASLLAERERIRELTVLQEAARALSGSLDRQVILDVALRFAVEAGPESARVCAQIFEVAGATVTVAAEHDSDQLVGLNGSTALLTENTRLRQALITGRPQTGELTDKGFDATLAAAGVTTSAFVLLRCGPLTVGILHIGWDQQSPVTPAALRLLEGVAHLTGLALTNAESYKRLAAIAASDALTGLPNRREFERLLNANQEARFAVLAIDVDNLKVINDTYGHEAGDATIKAIAAVLRDGLRPQDLIARTGGDEFSALLAEVGEAEAAMVAERLRRAMQGVPTPSGLGSISVGCAWSAAGGDPKVLWSMADEALYVAKRGGRNRVHRTASGYAASPALAPPKWDVVVEQVLANRDVTTVYQPIVALRGRDVIGYEALARARGVAADLGVDGLFAAAQRLGLGPDLDWLCRRAAVAGMGSLPRGQLFINVGVSALVDPLHGVDQMLLLLRWAQADAEAVVLEITEREAVRDLGRFEEVLAAYREHGFRFALDDVGEGHSTFELLASAAPEFVKISSRLVIRRSAAAQQSAIRGIVAFAAASGATVIAEGIESEEDARVMADLGVVLGQGWALGRPAAAEELGDRPALLELPPRAGDPAPLPRLRPAAADGPAVVTG